MNDDDVSTKSITLFIIELGIWVLRASGNLGCNGGTFFGSGRLQQIMMMRLDIKRGNKGFWHCRQTELDLWNPFTNSAVASCVSRYHY